MVDGQASSEYWLAFAGSDPVKDTVQIGTTSW